MYYPKLNPTVALITCFEGEGGTGTGTDDKPITMTQAQLDAIVTTRAQAAVKKAEENARTALTQLETLRGSATLNEEQRKLYDSEITELKKKVLTTEELAKQERDKIANKYKVDLDTAEVAAKTWKVRHDALLIDLEINKAVIDHEVEKGMDVMLKAHLGPQTRLVEEKDDQGNVVKYIPTIDFDETDAKGVKTTVTLPLSKVVGKMKEKPEFAPLFKGVKKSGIGGSNGSNGAGEPDPNNMSTEQYAAWHKATGKW